MWHSYIRRRYTHRGKSTTKMTPYRRLPIFGLTTKDALSAPPLPNKKECTAIRLLAVNKRFVDLLLFLGYNDFIRTMRRDAYETVISICPIVLFCSLPHRVRSALQWRNDGSFLVCHCHTGGTILPAVYLNCRIGV